MERVLFLLHVFLKTTLFRYLILKYFDYGGSGIPTSCHNLHHIYVLAGHGK